MDRGVESTRDQHQIWLELASNREKQRFARVHVVVIAQLYDFVVVSIVFVDQRACLPRHVDVEASTFTLTDVLALAVFSEWIESKVIASMQGHQHDLVRVVKYALGPITLVNVPIKDQHFFALINSVLSSDRNAIQEAKSIGFRLVSVMTGWSDNRVASRSFLWLTRQAKVNTRETSIYSNPARVVSVHIFIVVFGIHIRGALSWFERL